MSGVDHMLEHIYRRLGWRMIVAYQVFSYVGIGACVSALVVVFARVEQLSAADTWQLLAVGWAVIVGAGVISTVGIRRSCVDLIAWLAGPCDPDGGVAAWRRALRLPQITASWNGLVLPPFASVWIVRASELAALDARSIVWVVLGGVFAGTTVAVGGMFTAQIVSRPIVRDIASSLDGRPTWTPGVSLRFKLIAGLPPVMLATSGFILALGLDPGSNLGDALPRLLIAMACILAFAVPISLLLAYSTIQPLDDLIRATERIRHGDFTTPVPELTADEHGLLARSMNEAMEGLAERQHLAAANEQLLEEVRSSRARIVAASDAERRRVERNIHDGAQQQLVALALKLKLLEERAEHDDALRAAIAETGQRLNAALQELRELARGLHPSVLTTDGLAPALDQLASRAPLPVTVTASDERFPEAIESTVYYVAAEALANVAKYAQASHAGVELACHDGRVVIRVSDDGTGGADGRAGSGLAGLADRVAALDGRLAVDSPAGRGTIVTAELPLP